MNFDLILQTKDHNPHYLNRYISFIKLRSNRTEIEHGELHHICPKAPDLFPQYSSFKDHSWNRIKLTHREHYIAHKLLAKAFGKSQLFAFWAMCTKQSRDSKRKYKVSSRDYELAKKASSKELSERRTGVKNPKLSAFRKTVVQAKDVDGNIICVTKEEFKNRDDLVGMHKGRVLSDDHRRKIRENARDQSHYVHIENSITGEKSFAPEWSLLYMNPEWIKKFSAIYDRKNYQTTCPHCDKTVDNSNYKRWHGDKCKAKLV